MAMKLSTGKVAFPIEFDNGDKDCIYFNPNDPNLGARLLNARNKITKKIENITFDDTETKELLNGVEINKIGDFLNLSEEQQNAVEQKAEKVFEVINETQKVIYEELDKAFESDVSRVVFKHCSPFAITNGQYFILQFFEVIAPEIQKYTNKANSEVEKKMAKHLNKYAK